MKAYIGTFVKDDESEATITIGGNSLAHAARKAAAVEEEDKSECIKLELTDKVIL